MKKLVVGLLLVSSVSQADIVCKGTIAKSGAPAQVVISKDQVVVSGGSLHKPNVFTGLASIGGLITARGLAVSFENQYGCIREATIIADFRGEGYADILQVNTCSGGDTPDEICHPTND